VFIIERLPLLHMTNSIDLTTHLSRLSNNQLRLRNLGKPSQTFLSTKTAGNVSSERVPVFEQADFAGPFVCITE